MSRIPIVIPKFRSFASSQPGMYARSALIANIACWRPSISPRVRSSALVPSISDRWIRLRYVRSPWSVTVPHVPANVMRFSGISPASTALLNGLRRNGENSSSSLPVVSMSHSALPAQSR